MDDRVLVYRGADQPDMSVINPESDVWQLIKVYAAVRVWLMADPERVYLRSLAFTLRQYI